MDADPLGEGLLAFAEAKSRRLEVSMCNHCDLVYGGFIGESQ